jgi:hypothetical protein
VIFALRYAQQNIILIETVRYFSEFFVKVACMALLSLFGDEVTVKAVVTNGGELVVIGIDCR